MKVIEDLESGTIYDLVKDLAGNATGGMIQHLMLV